MIYRQCQVSSFSFGFSSQNKEAIKVLTNKANVVKILTNLSLKLFIFIYVQGKTLSEIKFQK